MKPSKDWIALPAFYAISRAPLVLAGAVGVGVVLLGRQVAASFATYFVFLILSGLSAAAVLMVCALPVLRTETGRRAIEDGCWEMADRIADWAEWEDSRVSMDTRTHPAPPADTAVNVYGLSTDMGPLPAGSLETFADLSAPRGPVVPTDAQIAAVVEAYKAGDPRPALDLRDCSLYPQDTVLRIRRALD